MSKRLITEEFISKAKSIHGNKYDYDKVNYINARIHIKIYCNTCNKYFNQTPDKHINRKQGCNQCGIISTTKKHKSTSIKFMETNMIIA